MCENLFFFFNYKMIAVSMQRKVYSSGKMEHYTQNDLVLYLNLLLYII